MPSRAAIWKQLGPFGGPAEYVVTSPSTPDLVLAGTPNAMLYRSADAGASWEHLPFPAELAASLHVVLPHPTEARRMLVGVSPDSGGSGLYLSTDSGRSWQGIAAFHGKAVWALAHFAADPNLMAAGVADGVYASSDAGETWRRMSSDQETDLMPVVSVAIHPTRFEIVYAGTPHLPWKTSTGGRTWQSIHAGMLDDSDVFSIDIDRKHPARVVASACSGLYRSLNAGTLWTKLRGSADASFRTYAVAFDPHVAGRLWAGTTKGLMRSTDGGVTWRTLAKNSVKSIAFDPQHAGVVYLATRDAGILKSTDGATFAPVNQGFANRSFAGLAAKGESLMLKGDGILENAAGAPDWKKALPKASALCGNTGTLKDAVRAMACDGSRLLAVTGQAAMQSGDGGQTWTPLAPPDAALEWNQLAPAGRDALLAATSHGLLRSADGGRTWTPAPGELGRATVSTVVAHPERPGCLFAALYDQVFASTDDGLSWKALPSQGLERAAIRALAIVKGRPGRLYALAAGRGVFVTDLE